MTIAPQISVSVSPSIVTTTNGTSTVTLLSVPFHDTTGAQAITFDVTGYDFDNGDVASAKIHVKVKNVNGTLTMVGTPVHLVPIAAGSSSSLQTASVTAVVSGSNVNLNVIGVTGKTIKWVAYANPGIEVLNTWTAVPTPEDGYVQTWSTSRTRWEPVSVTSAMSSTIAGSAIAGDVTGTIDTTTVVKLQNRAVSSAAPSDGYVLTWNNGNNRWEAAETGALVPIGGDDASGSLSSLTVVGLTGDMTTNPPITTIRLGDPTPSFSVSQEIRVGPESINVSSVGSLPPEQIIFHGQDNVSGAFGTLSGGNITIRGGNAGSGIGGNVYIKGGAASGQDGYIYLGDNATYGVWIDAISNIQLRWNGGSGTPDPGSLNLTNINTSNTANSGAATLPSNPVGFITVTIAGSVRKIPYYAT